MKIKKPILALFCLFLFTLVQAQVSKTINNTAGNLAVKFTQAERQTITNLKVTGTLNMSDFFYMRDSLTVLQILDLSESRIISPLDTIPVEAFKNKVTLQQISFPTNLVRIGSAAFYSCSGLLSVEVPATVTSIGASAFSRCGLKSVVLPPTNISFHGWAFDNCDSLTTATTPYTYAGGNIFMGCRNLRTIIVPEGVTTIKGGAFYQLTTMTNITLPSTLNSIETHAFYNCTALDSITIPEGVTTIGEGAFWECNNMKSLRLPKSLISIKSTAFAHCRSLTTVEIPANASSVESAAFRACTGLKTIITSSATGVYGGNIFEYCTNIKNIIIPEGTIAIKNNAFSSNFASVSSITIPASVKSIGERAFYACSGIESISIPDSVSTIGAYAFSGCSGLTTVNIPDAVSNLGIYSFQNCSSLSSINLPASLTSISEGVFMGCSKLATVNLPNSIVSIANYAFSGCVLLDLVTIPSSVISIGVSSFSGCTSLKSIVIPNSVSTINASAFSGCTGLASVQFPNYLSFIGYQAFLGCNALTSITIPANTTINNNAFQNCKGLLVATTPYAYNSGNVFEGCLNLKTIVIPTGMTSIRDYAFYNCNSLDSIHIPNSVYTIGSNAFNGCSNLKKLNLPKYLHTIKDYAFANCSSLNSISFPTTVSVIPYACFSRCNSLKSITIPASINTINSYAFDGCTGLNSIFIENPFPIDLNNFQLVFNSVNKTSCILNVPYMTKARYQAANQWKDFTQIVESPTGIFINSDKVDLLANPGSSISVDVKANVAWTASSSHSWLTVSPDSGIGDKALIFTSDNTHITAIRKAKITLSAPGIVSQTIEVTQKLFPKTVSISAGGLLAALTSDELNSLSTLIVTGTMDARDFKTMRDSMPQLTDLDLTGVSIDAYTGVDGTFHNSITYAANAIPVYAFFTSNTGKGKTNLKNIELPSTITSIGSYAFAACSGINNLSIPPTVVSISSNAFNSCTDLSSITIPTSVSSIGSNAFYNCSALTSIIMHSSYPIDLSSTNNVFYNVNKTNCSLYVPYGSKALYMAKPQWNSFTNIVENTKGFIFGTNKLILPYNAGSSIAVDLKSNVNWTISSDQSWLTFNTSSGTGNSTLILIAEDNLTTTVRKATLTLSAPDCIPQVLEVVQNTAPKTIDVIAGGLSNALTTDDLSSLSALTLIGTLDARDFKTLRDKMPLLTDLDLTGASILEYIGTEGTYPSINSITYPANKIPQFAFYGNKTLKNVLISSTVTAIDSYAFQNCSALNSFSIPSTINSLGHYVFSGCSGLTSIYSNSSYPIDISGIYNVFYNVNKTTCTLYVPYKAKALYTTAFQWNTFTNIVENTQGFFVEPNMLKIAYVEGSSGTLDISANVSWSVNSDQEWLTVNPSSGSGNQKLTFIAEQNDTTAQRYAKVTISSSGFDSQVINIAQTGSPKSINISSGGLFTALTAEELSFISDLKIIGTMDARDFKTLRDNMPELTRLDISEARITAFKGDGGTYSFNTSYRANEIPPSAFYVYSYDKAKTSLVSIKIPASVTYIGSSAFQGCTGLTSIYINSVYPIDFTNSGDPFYKMNKAGCTLYVPYATKSSYSTATAWKDFKNIVESDSGFLVSQKSVKFSSSVKIKRIAIPVKANVVWDAQSNQPWLAVSANDSILTLTAEPNPSDTIRKASVTVTSPGFDSQIVDITQAAAPLTVMAGGLSTLLTASELSAMTDLALMGTMDARDFKTIRDKMPALANLDLNAITVVAYQGKDGTARNGLNTNYLDNEIPTEAFNYYIKTVILPESTVSVGSYAFSNAGNLISIEWPTSLRFINDYAFSNSAKLQLVSLPDSLISIGVGAFQGCRGLNGKLILPLNLKTIGASAFSNCSGLNDELVIPSSVNTIGESAFAGCYGLSSLIIKPLDPIIGAKAFSGCSALKSITLPTTLTTIGEGVFSYCLNVKSISLPPTLKSIGKEAFQVCAGLSSIDFPASLTEIGESSFSNSGLISLTIPSTLTNIGAYAFTGCKSLVNVSVPLDLKSIPNGMFSDCSNLGSFEFPLGLETIGENAFSHCTSLVNVSLPPLINTIKPYTFSGCWGLKSVSFPASLTSIGSRSFSYCRELTSLVIPHLVKSIGYEAFAGCSKLISVILPPELSSIEWKLFENCSSLASVDIPSSVKSIADNAFYNCTSLTSIVIPASVETLGNSSFYNCSNLIDLKLTSGLKSIGDKAFRNCAKLTNVNMPATLKTIGAYAFENCQSLTTVKLNENLEAIDYRCFSDCINLSNINLPNTLKKIGGFCFLNCYSLKSIVIPPLITEIGSFDNCKNLTSVTLNEGLKSVSGFSGCGFSSITLPSSLTNIGYKAFSACNNLTSIDIPNNVNRIDDYAFGSCENLKSVKIPASVTSIDVGAFGSCKALSSVYLYSSTPVDMSFGGDGFWGVNKATCILYVPIGSKKAYQETKFWNEFAQIVEMPTSVSALLDEKINVYSDPVTKSIRIQGIEGIVTITLYDINAKVLLHKQVQANEYISVSDVPKGIYIIRIITNEGTIERKIFNE